MSFEIFSIFSLGFLLGLEHAFEADHVAAIATISSRSGSVKKALLTGIAWGAGHTAMLLIVGMILLSSHWIIPQKITIFLETLVGIMLIFLGIKNLFGYKKILLHFHDSDHNSDEKKIIHFHPHKENHHHEKISFWIGAIHGLAGSAALMLIIASSIQSIALGIFYIFLFGIGSILGMGIVSILIGLPSLALQKKSEKFQKIIPQIAGGFSIVVGIMLIYEVTIF